MKIIFILIVMNIFNNVFCQVLNPNYTISCDPACLDKEYAFEFCKIINGKQIGSQNAQKIQTLNLD